jgi:nucleoside-specific outer membrane channel protein Tsx
MDGDMKNNFRSTMLATLLAASVGASAQETLATHESSHNWNDTAVGFRYSDDFYFPGSDEKVTQKIGVLTTVGGFKFGTYVFNVDFLVSDEHNPSAGSNRGAQEVYSVGRVDFDANKVFGHPLSFGVIKDVGLTTGYEFSSKDDAFGSRARMLVLGPSVQFAVPRGYWNAMIGARTETNYNAIVHSEVHYDTAAHAETSWMFPFNVGAVPLVFKGFISVTGPKGDDGFHIPTKTEILARPALLVDVGALAGHPRTFYAGPGFEYWHNEFGTPSSENVGTRRSAVTFVAEAHF